MFVSTFRCPRACFTSLLLLWPVQFALQAQTPAVLPARLTLPQAEDLLLQRNLPVIAARQQTEMFEAARRAAGLRPNPVFQFSAEQIPVTSNLRGAVPNFYRTNSDAAAMPTYTAQLGQLLERGGKRELRSGQASAFVNAAKAQTLDVFRDQLLQLRQAFTAALLAKANLQLAEETDKQYAETERLMTIRLAGGEIAEVDLDRVKAARVPFLQTVLESRLAYNQALKQVVTLLSAAGVRAGSGAPEIEGELDWDGTIPPLEKLRAMAIAERPDLQGAKAQLQAAERGTRLAEAQRKRDVFASFMLQRTGQDHAVGGSVSVPLFWFNNQRDLIAQAAAAQRVATTQVRQSEVVVENDVDRAWEAVNAAKQSLELFSREAIERSRAIRSIITYSYQKGEAGLLEVLDAQRSANQILLGYNQARASYLSAVWQLQYAVGRSF